MFNFFASKGNLLWNLQKGNTLKETSCGSGRYNSLELYFRKYITNLIKWQQQYWYDLIKKLLINL